MPHVDRALRVQGQKGGLAGGGQRVWNLTRGQAKVRQGCPILDPEAAKVPGVPRRVVAPAVGVPEHRHRQSPGVLQRKDQIALCRANHGGPAQKPGGVFDA